MSQLFSQYIKIIGKGQKGSRSLTHDEAHTAMGMLLNGDITHDQRGAFLMLLRTREETPEEITGFVLACRQHLSSGLDNINAKLDVGCYAGKRRQLPWYLLAVACLAKNGVPVFLHGAEEPGSGRMYASHVLPALGLPAINSLQAASEQLRSYGATYLDMGVFLPPLNKVIKLRAEFGLRSCANTLARLLNPSAAPFSVQGVYHMHLDHKHTRVNEQFNAYNSLCFRGDGGDPEVNSERPTELFFTRNGQTQAIILPEAGTGWAMKERAMDPQLLLAVWRGEKDHKYAQQAIVATLTSYLMLVENSDMAEAQNQARQLWGSRNINELPFSP